MTIVWIYWRGEVLWGCQGCKNTRSNIHPALCGSGSWGGWGLLGRVRTTQGLATMCALNREKLTSKEKIQVCSHLRDFVVRKPDTESHQVGFEQRPVSLWADGARQHPIMQLNAKTVQPKNKLQQTGSIILALTPHHRFKYRQTANASAWQPSSSHGSWDSWFKSRHTNIIHEFSLFWEFSKNGKTFLILKISRLSVVCLVLGSSVFCFLLVEVVQIISSNYRLLHFEF